MNVILASCNKEHQVFYFEGMLFTIFWCKLEAIIEMCGCYYCGSEDILVNVVISVACDWKYVIVHKPHVKEEALFKTIIYQLKGGHLEVVVLFYCAKALPLECM